MLGAGEVIAEGGAGESAQASQCPSRGPVELGPAANPKGAGGVERAATRGLGVMVTVGGDGAEPNELVTVASS